MKNPMDGEVNSKNISWAQVDMRDRRTIISASDLVAAEYMTLYPINIAVDGDVITMALKSDEKFKRVYINLTPEIKAQLIKDLQK